MKLRQLVEEYLKEARMMQVATAKDGQPWACTVYFAFDKELNLYWISTPTRRHSLEIENNSKVAGVIVLPHKPGQEVRGIQFEGVAKSLGKKESMNALKHYMLRFGMPIKRVKEILAGKDKHVCYGIKPSSIILFDEVNYPDSPRQEYKL
jgi:uncharacterized protein YhbP (UPF0306 family)